MNNVVNIEFHDVKISSKNSFYFKYVAYKISDSYNGFEFFVSRGKIQGFHLKIAIFSLDYVKIADTWNNDRYK